ncbi:MAG: alkaline phosphatase PhoX [Candidatus Nanopelagicales bacterium]
MRITSLLTVGDAPDGYRMVGIPDALGAAPGVKGKVDLLMNHELRSSQGVTRAHGQPGAFVSRWTLDPRTGAVSGGSDLITRVIDWDYTTGEYESNTVANSPFYRLCSGSLSEAGQLINRRSGRGYDGRIYFANEEGEQVRTFGVTMGGTAYQLPRMGRLPSENTIVAPTRGDRTVVVANEDGNTDTSQLRVYWGTKTRKGSPVDRAGLTNGVLNVLKVAGVADDTGFRATYGKGTPAPVTFGALDWTLPPAEQNTSGLASGALGFTRIEDGNFDPRKPNDYYFLTTEGGDTTPAPGTGYKRDGGGLWRLRFADVNKPELGGTLTLLLDGSEAPYLSKPDNMTIDRHGNMLIQEDPGGNDHVGRIVAYRLADGARGVVATFDPVQFAVGAPDFITIDEESSGIIDVSQLWKRPNTFLFDAQVHASADDAELVEKGQLLTLTVRSWGRVYGGKTHSH